jgi:murein DD-endopeptidase MepM/ murein hydrolase activator NlpD
MTPEQYIKDAMADGRLTLRHIEALTRYFQDHAGTKVDGMPGPFTMGVLERVMPAFFAPKEPGKFLSLPLPTIRGASGARKPKVTSSFRPADRPNHDGWDWFYRWEDGDKPAFVGDGGCEGKNADGSPKWVVPYGTYAHAAAPGVVQVAGPSPTGYRVWVNHGNGLRTGYFHLSNVVVKQGDTISAYTALGLVGHNPSGGADGNHLHFEVSPVEKYEPLDPAKYMKEGLL